MAEARFQIIEIARIQDPSLMDSYLWKTSSPGKRIVLELIKLLFRLLIRGEGLTYQFVIKSVPIFV